RARRLPGAVGVGAALPLRPFSVAGYLSGLAREVEAQPWPAGVEALPVAFLEAGQSAPPSTEKPPRPLLPHEAGHLVLETSGLHAAGGASHAAAGAGGMDPRGPAIQDTAKPSIFFDEAGPARWVAMLAAEGDGRLRPTAARTLDAARFVAQFVPGGAATAVLLVAPADEGAQRRAAAEALRPGAGDLCLLVAPEAESSDEVPPRLLAQSSPAPPHPSPRAAPQPRP